jgi:hypothetical protein
VFLISANAATTVTVSGTPASGAYNIYTLQTERYDAAHIHDDYLRLRSWPIKGIQTIYPDDETTDALATDDYKIFTDLGKLHMYGGWDEPEYYWTVKYVGGYLATDKEWPLLRHWQLTIADAMWNDSGYKRFVVDQFGQAKGTLNFDLINGDIYRAINLAHGARFRRITL